MSGTEGQAARATIGALPPNPPQPVESQQAGQQTPEVAQTTEGTQSTEASTAPTESSTAPTQSEGANLGAEMAALDPLALVGTIKSMVSLGVKVLGLVSKFPGPQQATAQELLKLLNEVNSVLSRLPF